MKTQKRDPKKIYMETFGCQMNKLDSELLMEEMSQRGYTLADSVKEAGLLIFNTCSVRAHAENRVYSYLGKLREEKKKHPHLIIAVIGCMAQLQRELIHKKMPHVDFILGTTQFLQLPELVEKIKSDDRVQCFYEIEDVKTNRRGSYLATPHSAFVSVIRGCDMPCTFCVVPTTRGPMKSRPMDEIIRESQMLRDRGVREITLLGQTVDGYGKDLERRLLLPSLLEKLNEISGLDRIRYITSHPSFITHELVEATAGLSRVCEYLHMPAQSGSDSVLKHMKRGYNRRKYLEKIQKIREVMPQCSIASDFIVGYPEETEEDFQLSLSLIEEARFQNSFIFKYSQRPATKASHWEDSIPEEVKKRRNQEMLALQSQVSLAWKESWVGQNMEVLVDGPSKKDPKMLSGRTRGNDIVVFPSDELLQGQLMTIHIEKANAYTLYGKRIIHKAKTALSVQEKF